jgi:hypothetical protein
VIGGASRVRSIEADGVSFTVVESQRLVRIDVPDGGAAHVTEQLGACQRVIQPPGSAVEDIAVGIRRACCGE